MIEISDVQQIQAFTYRVKQITGKTRHAGCLLSCSTRQYGLDCKNKYKIEEKKANKCKNHYKKLIVYYNKHFIFFRREVGLSRSKKKFKKQKV